MEFYFNAQNVALLLLFLFAGLAILIVSCGLMYLMCDLVESVREDFMDEYHDRQNR